MFSWFITKWQKNWTQILHWVKIERGTSFPPIRRFQPQVQYWSVGGWLWRDLFPSGVDLPSFQVRWSFSLHWVHQLHLHLRLQCQSTWVLFFGLCISTDIYFYRVLVVFWSPRLPCLSVYLGRLNIKAMQCGEQPGDVRSCTLGDWLGGNAWREGVRYFRLDTFKI